MFYLNSISPSTSPPDVPGYLKPHKHMNCDIQPLLTYQLHNERVVGEIVHPILPPLFPPHGCVLSELALVNGSQYLTVSQHYSLHPNSP